MLPESNFSDEEIKNRCATFYGNVQEFSREKIPNFRFKWASLSEFLKEIKQSFSRYDNKRHNRRGTLWGERFKSLIVEDGETLINWLAYIDLNPIRANIVERPEDYRWTSIGYHIQSKNKYNFLSLDFGLKEFGAMDAEERLRRYRRYIYEAGALKRSDGKSSTTIDENVIKRERKADFKMTRVDRFRYRTRYFTDSGIIGSRDFVSRNYKQFKDLFQSKHEKRPKPVKGLDGVYSLKRLAEAV